MGRMRSVQLLEGCKIAVELENGSSFVYDLKPRLSAVRFAPLADPELFQSGRLAEGDCIRWSDSLILYSYEMLDGMKR